MSHYLNKIIYIILLMQGVFVMPAMAENKGQGLAVNGVLWGASSDSISTGAVLFVMQPDCNLVAYQGSKAVWNSHTNGKGNGCHAVMQGDGNLVVYRGGDNKAVWSSGTHKYPNSHLVAQNDGNVVIYQGSTARWATNTVIKRPSGSGGGTAGPFPGCVYVRTDTKCVIVTYWIKEVYNCPSNSSIFGQEKSTSWHISGACFGFDW